MSSFNNDIPIGAPVNPSFETIITSWHDFYLLVGTGAFTLIGLMFVAVTFGAHLIDEKNMPMARAFLDPTIIHFVQVLVISGIALMPQMGTALFGGLLTGGGVLSLIVLIGVHKGLRDAQRKFNDLELADWVSGFVIPLAVYLGYTACGIFFWMGHTPFAALAVLTIVILLNSIYCAWELILWFAVVRTRRALQKIHAKNKLKRS
jgi:hypothetical protein